MPFIAPFVPLITAGVTSAMGVVGAKKQASAAGAASKETSDLARQQSEMAKEIMSFGKGQIAASGPALNKAMQYYMQVAGGNRGQIGSAIAPDIAGVTESSRGAQRGIEAQIGAGPQRDREIAELQRQKSGQIGMMPMLARQGGMQGLERLGGAAAQRGAGAMTAAAGANMGAGSLLNTAYNQGQEGRNAWSDLGANLMNIWGPYLMGMGGKKKPPLAGRQIGTGMMPGLPGGF